MSSINLLYTFIVLKSLQFLWTKWLDQKNERYYSNAENQDRVAKELSLDSADLKQSLEYAKDKASLSKVQSWLDFGLLIAVLFLGGFGWLAQTSSSLVGQYGTIVEGLVFFGILGFASTVIHLPFSVYSTFVVEEKHGFNNQTPKQFVIDLVKSSVIGILLGAPLLAALLWVIGSLGNNWWIVAWVLMSGFSMIAAWLFPTLIAPLFNKFKPLPEGELKNAIYELAKKVEFKTSGLFVMDASIRSSHGNAYFTGMFGQKRIVLFDTLVEALTSNEIVAVLAHELGHFKLHHVRGMLIRGILMTGGMFYLMGLAQSIPSIFEAFSFPEVQTSYALLIVFSLWFGLVDQFITPISTMLSRKNEFEADRFAIENVGNYEDLASALGKLRAKSKSLPLVDPLYSTIYYSHPPIVERIAAMKKI